MDVNRIKTQSADYRFDISGYTCVFCHQKFQTKTDLLQHQYNVHGLKTYSCDICGQKFLKKQNMATHRRIHTGEKPYTCGICQQSFHAMSGLRHHQQRYHVGENIGFDSSY